MDIKRLGTTACTALLKTMLMIFNIVFFAIGIVFLVVGIYGITAFRDFFTFAPSQAIYVPIICIALFMCIVGVLALWCTPKGVVWLLNLYSIVVFILFLSIFTISILFVVRRDTFENTIKDGIINSINGYPVDRTSIDLLQEHIECCGLSNYTDWFETKWANGHKSVPESCCKAKSTLDHPCAHNDLVQDNLTDIYQDGCYRKMSATIDEKYMLIAGIGFGASLAILLGSLLTCVLSRNLKNNRYEPVE